MLSYYNYWQATRRFEQSKETIKMMEPDVPPMITAQHEMIQREMEFFREESQKFTLIILTLLVFFSIMVVMFMKGFIHV
jgi:hypothetical protein